MWKEREQCPKFLHFGLQRSGTNYFEGLMYRHFEVWCRNRGSGPHWKHSLQMPEQITDEFMYFVISKNPYTWIESIAFRNPMDYIERQRRYPVDDRNINTDLLAGKKQLNVVNMARTWNHFYRNWMEISPNPRILVLRYEDLLDLKYKSLVAIGIYFDLPRRENASQYRSMETSLLDRKMNQSNIDYYTRGTPKHLTDVQVEAISKQLDPKVVKFYGYSKY